jgi:glycosyltransferase involved in cell wall biosynthesis
MDEGQDIGNVIREIPREIRGVSSVRVLVLDDGSLDGTTAVALEAGADWIIHNKRNMGLAFSFQRALEEALARGADIIVNTDGDNHYDQSAIPKLIAPILRGEADIVIGSRLLDAVRMPKANRYGNKFANAMMQRVLHLPGVDVSTGFRAYSREAALRLVVFSRHTYTHESLLSAIDQRLVIVNRPIPARTVNRPSRLISSVPRHVWQAGITILRSFLLYRPLELFLLAGAALILVSGALGLRFLLYWFQGDGGGHVQSLLLGLGLLYAGGQVILLGLLADALRANRRLMQEALRNTRVLVAREQPSDAAVPATAPRALAEAAAALSANGHRRGVPFDLVEKTHGAIAHGAPGDLGDRDHHGPA